MRVIAAIVLFCICAVQSAAAQVHIFDGDTIEIDRTVIRLNGIDAPEVGQKCMLAEGQWNCGQAAIDKLASLIQGQDISCSERSLDGYGRTIGTCFVEGLDIGEVMVRTGYAWAFVRYSNTYEDAEAAARSEKIGIWQGDAQPAWEYRSERWATYEHTAPNGCPIKGNISNNGRIYHPPWSPWYSRTKINEAKGERWFCSEADAVAAGWRAPRWH